MLDTESAPNTHFTPAVERTTIPSRVRGIVSLIDNISANAIRQSLLNPKLGMTLEKTFYKHIASLYLLDRVVFCSLLAASRIPGVEQKLEDKYLKQEARSFRVGKHMIVFPNMYTDKKPIPLSDGTVISQYHHLGELHFSEDLPTLEQGGNLVTFTRQLYGAATESLEELAHLCQDNDPRVIGLAFFYGESHIAGSLAKKLGFDIHEISNPFRKLMQYYKGRWLVEQIAGKNPTWRHWKKNYKPPQRAYISRKRLVELFGRKPVPESPKVSPKQSILEKLGFLKGSLKQSR